MYSFYCVVDLIHGQRIELGVKKFSFPPQRGDYVSVDKYKTEVEFRVIYDRDATPTLKLKEIKSEVAMQNL